MDSHFYKTLRKNIYGLITNATKPKVTALAQNT
jgi:hypothetical protein